MREKSPQKIGEELEGRIFAICEGHLECLVRPAVKREMVAEIEEMSLELENVVKDGETRECLRAGLWLLADDLDKAHRICQEVPTNYGSAWHAVVHRREGDFWNSKYWWRRAGGVRWEELADCIAKECRGGPEEVLTCVAGNSYDPARLVDLVEANQERGSAEIRAALVTVQRIEWKALFSETWARL